MSSFYEFEICTPSGATLCMNDYREKSVLIVNTATKCRFTPQFDGLEMLHQKYKDQGLIILGVPCDQFANQEPETNDTLEEVCRVNHGVTFQLTGKYHVNGPNTHPLFDYLKNEKGGILSKSIKWNFTKFLINKKGQVIKRYSPTTRPEKIESDIQNIL